MFQINDFIIQLILYDTLFSLNIINLNNICLSTNKLNNKNINVKQNLFNLNYKIDINDNDKNVYGHPFFNVCPKLIFKSHVVDCK